MMNPIERPPAGGPRHDADIAPGEAAAAVPVDIHRLLVETVQDYAIFVLDPHGRILTWNPGAERLKGYTAGEIVGKHFSVFYTREAVERGHPGYELTVAEARGRYEEEGWRLRKGGSPFWASVTITSLRDENGVLVGFAKVTRDLTERKLYMEALQESEQRFRLLVKSVKDYGIFMLDPHGHIASWNEGAEEIKGYTEQEVLGRHFSLFYPEEEVARDKPAMELRRATEQGRFEDEGWRLKKDGTRFWANVVITPLRDGDGLLLGFAKVTRDLTERRASEQRAIEDARELARLEATNRTRSEFLTGMSHDLRTPLNAIAGYVDLLGHGVYGELSDAQAATLERIRASQEHLLTLINDLVQFGTIEGGRLVYDRTPLDLSDILVGTVRSMIEPMALGKDISIEWQGVNGPVQAVADRTRVEQVLLNLVSNAVKYTETGGAVRICALLRDGRAVVEVSDTGVGIPAEYLEAVFEPFVQVDRGAGKSDGSGLGLAISHHLARAMGGNLYVESTVGEGSTFTLELPAEE
jgi:PAS domain S-box-containing protein